MSKKKCVVIDINKKKKEKAEKRQKIIDAGIKKLADELRWNKPKK